jgi:hypothetical protein
MANKARGVISAQIGDEEIELAMGLGALAEIEDAFGVESFEDALNFGEKTSAKKLKAFMTALLKGNEVELTPTRVKAVSRMTAAQFMAIIFDLLEASGMKQASEGAARPEGGSAPFEEPNAGAHG